MLPVQYEDVVAARPRVAEHLRPTALHYWPGLSKLLGCEFYLKHENHQPTGAFKVRGGINLVATLSVPSPLPLSPEGRGVGSGGILGCTTGNHGQSLAFAARRFGVRAVMVVPEGNNPDKNRAMRLWGAELIEHGRDFDEAKQHCETIRERLGLRYVHSANEPMLIAGVGTMALEIFDELPDPDVILVPVGLGSGACGTCLVASRMRPETQVIGVQAEGAPAVAHSWQRGEWVTYRSVSTWAEGMATRAPAEMTLDILRRYLSDVVLVGDDELRDAVRLLLRETHNLAEGAGAASTAAALKIRDRLAGKKVVGILSGGNIDLRELGAILGRQ